MPKKLKKVTTLIQHLVNSVSNKNWKQQSTSFFALPLTCTHLCAYQSFWLQVVADKKIKNKCLLLCIAHARNAKLETMLIEVHNVFSSLQWHTPKIKWTANQLCLLYFYIACSYFCHSAAAKQQMQEKSNILQFSWWNLQFSYYSSIWHTPRKPNNQLVVSVTCSHCLQLVLVAFD